ncbi:UbiA prenyltransferase family-domain-containing protein [Aspergillus venezuelensis]
MLELLWKEVDITYRLLIDNWLHFLVGYHSLLLPRLVLQPVSYNQSVEALCSTLAFSLITAYQFEIAHQTISPAEEDRLNKPHRPIPAGLLTIQQARRRWILSWVFIPVVFQIYLNTEATIWACLTQAVTAFFYVWPAFNNFLCRNIFVATISFTLLRLINVLYSSIAPELSLSIWIEGAFCLWLATTVHIQEFRDVEGDRAANKRTLAVILSERAMHWVKVLTAAYVVSISVLVCWLVPQYVSTSDQLVVWIGYLHLVASVNLAVRLISSEDVPQSIYHYFYYLVLWSLILLLEGAYYRSTR